MPLRSECLLDGRIIGIEYFYTVIDGKQINIPERLSFLRAKGRDKQLFCPCGCGANLTIVAGDRNLREQHFRLLDNADECNCHVVTEGRRSVLSKIVLKGWLDDKLNAADLESRVQICAVDDVDRKYEFTFLSAEKHLGLVYSYHRKNIATEKFEILEQNSQGIVTVYVVDATNCEFEGQYPEAMMKIQNKQGYCLLLTPADINPEERYQASCLSAVYYDRDYFGLWVEITLAEGLLKDFWFDADLMLFYQGERIIDLLERSKAERRQAFEAQRKRDEELKRQQEIKAKKYAEERKRREEEEALRKAEEEKRKREWFDQEKARRLQEEAEAEQIRQRLEKERAEAEVSRLRAEQAFKAMIESGEVSQDEILKDADGNRWVQCKYCHSVKMTTEFSWYGGEGSVNLGLCKECRKKPEVLNAEREKSHVEAPAQPLYDPTLCPQCKTGKLRLRSGKYGDFYGCSNYPNCAYTRNI